MKTFRVTESNGASSRSKESSAEDLPTISIHKINRLGASALRALRTGEAPSFQAMGKVRR